ncbi:MAG: histidine phosphatase family protein [Rhizobiales bacterium]|nr:histidine phosphatase family protein [Hyphomicrobiales bacterium]
MLNKVRSLLLQVQFIVCLLAWFGGSAHAVEPDALWAAVRDRSAFIMMRHTLAPGTGDPDGFDVNECSTQRNLSDDGRRQAVQAGAWLRKNGIERAAVFSSAWCRCLDTARLLDVGPVELLAPLNSFFGNREQREPQMAALRDWLAGYTLEMPLILVTHQVNITALTGAFARSGDMLVVRRGPDGTFAVLGKL